MKSVIVTGLYVIGIGITFGINAYLGAGFILFVSAMAGR